MKNKTEFRDRLHVFSNLVQSGEGPKAKFHMDKALFGQRIRNARLKAGMSQADLAAAMHGVVSKKAISKYENGIMIPFVSVFYFMFRALDTSPDDFLVPFREDIKNLVFRKPLALGVRKGNMIEQQLAYVLERYLDLEELLGLDTTFYNPLPGVVVCNLEEIDRAAKALRGAWDLGMGALPNVHEILEAKGVKLAETEADPDFDAMACWVDGTYPMISVNKNLKPEFKRFVVLRELGHLLLEFAQGMAEKEREGLCRAFAGSMLIPNEILVGEMGPKKWKGINISFLVLLKETYGISLRALVDRAHGLKLVKQRDLTRFRSFMAAHPNEEDLGEFQGREHSQRFRRLVLRAFLEERMNLNGASTFLNVNPSELKEEFMLLGVQGEDGKIDKK